MVTCSSSRGAYKHNQVSTLIIHNSNSLMAIFMLILAIGIIAGRHPVSRALDSTIEGSSSPAVDTALKDDDVVYEAISVSQHVHSSCCHMTSSLDGAAVPGSDSTFNDKVDHNKWMLRVFRLARYY